MSIGNIVDLQCCIVSFRYGSDFSYTYTYISLFKVTFPILDYWVNSIAILSYLLFILYVVSDSDLLFVMTLLIEKVLSLALKLAFFFDTCDLLLN